MQAPHFYPFISVIICLILGIHSPSVIAQSGTSPTHTTTADYTELQRDPISIDSIGLSINLPIDARAETVRIGSSTSTGIVLPADLGTITIKEQRTSNEDLTSIQAINAIRDQLLAVPGSSLISEHPTLRVGIWSGHRFYVRIKNPSAGGRDLFRGITIFGHKPKTFLVYDFSLEGTEEQFKIARILYETSIGTMDLQEMSSQSLKRVAGFQSTNALLEQLTIEDYDAALTGKKDERWERLYTTAPSGDEMDATEHGYRRVRSWSGYKGELADKDKSKWSSEDRKLGYLVQIDSMAIDAGFRIDSRALFFMSLDSNEELWTIRMTLKSQNDASGQNTPTKQDSTITGARVGGKLTITSTQGHNAPTTITPFIPESGYISQVQTYLMGSLITNKQLQGDFASYAYNPVTNSVTLRWDISEQPSQSPGLWTVTTKNAPDSPPSTTHFDAHGNLMRVRLTNGRLWEPIELDRLLSLWKRKGLPI